MNVDEISAQLAKHKPHEVLVMDGGEVTRTVKVPTNRKRWAAVVAVLDRLTWDRLELRAKGGDTLAIIEAESDNTIADEVAATNRDERMLKLLITAQQAALSSRDKESAAALNACVAVMREMTNAVATLSKVHELQLRAVQEAAANADEDDPNALGSLKLLMGLAPQLLGAAFGPKPAAKPNGVAKPRPAIDTQAKPTEAAG